MRETEDGLASLLVCKCLNLLGARIGIDIDLLLVNCGVPEANDSSEDMFGEQRLLDALNQYVDATPEELIGTVYEAVTQFRGDAPQFDDITMLCFRLNAE